MPKPLASALTVGLLSVLLAGAGCGGDDKSDGGSSAPPTSVPSQAKDVPDDPAALKERCMEDLVQSGESKEQADKACTVPDEAEVDKAVDSAVKDCLAAAEQLPAGSEREQAMSDCKESAE